MIGWVAGTPYKLEGHGDGKGTILETPLRLYWRAPEGLLVCMVFGEQLSPPNSYCILLLFVIGGQYRCTIDSARVKGARAWVHWTKSGAVVTIVCLAVERTTLLVIALPFFVVWLLSLKSLKCTL